jgi:hypothetical protein
LPITYVFYDKFVKKSISGDYPGGLTLNLQIKLTKKNKEGVYLPHLPGSGLFLDDFLAVIVAAAAAYPVGNLELPALRALDQGGCLKLPYA